MVKTPVQEEWVQFLAGELISNMLQIWPKIKKKKKRERDTLTHDTAFSCQERM